MWCIFSYFFFSLCDNCVGKYRDIFLNLFRASRLNWFKLIKVKSTRRRDFPSRIFDPEDREKLLDRINAHSRDIWTKFIRNERLFRKRSPITLQANIRVAFASRNGIIKQITISINLYWKQLGKPAPVERNDRLLFEDPPRRGEDPLSKKNNGVRE